MNWFQVSIIANVVFGIVILFLAHDRSFFKKVCDLRHNPIDLAIQEIKDDIKRIWDKLNES